MALRHGGAVQGAKCGLTVAMVLFYTAGARAQLSPGDLHSVHASLEGLENCRKCHDPNRSKMTERCLDCHQPLKARIARGEGLHSRPGHTECQKCHVEHQGRDYDLIWWDGGQDKFDHTLTGYVLEGAHSKAACRSCHQPRYLMDKDTLIAHKVDLARTFLGLGRACTSCHPDEHRAQLPLTCRDCHTMTAWKPAPAFDHDKTKFRLTGGHITTPCGKCHQTVADNRSESDRDFLRFAGLKYTLCTDCHRDVHANRFGPACEKCHNTSGWKATDRSKFEHDRTRYPLTGSHIKVTCEKCHKPGQSLRGLKFEKCTDCHPDSHKGQFAARASHGACEECHTVAEFSPARFTMAQHDQTDYPLRGAHVAVACNACHKKDRTQSKAAEIRFDFKSTRCLVCHADPHKPQLKKIVSSSGCEFCHVDAAWDQVHFDHDKTEYPLLGRHREITCRACHHAADGIKADFATLAKTCASCHKDPHHGQFLTTIASAQSDGVQASCERCHTPKSWGAEKFNHDTDATYKLEGAHRRVPCSGCHKPVTAEGMRYVIYRPLDTACKSCHSSSVTKEGLDKG